MTQNDRRIRSLLDQLPIGLDETYIQCLRRIDKNKSVAAKTFRWIASAKQPLTSQQLREAVSMEPDNVDLGKPDILNSCVTQYCSNLVTAGLTQRRVDFFHVSVKQFLQDRNRLPKDLAAYRLDQNEDNLWCLEICLAYLKVQQLKKKKIVLRRQGALPGNVSHAVLRDVPGGSVASAFARFFSERTTSPGQVYRLPMPGTAHVSLPVSLEMHHYIVAHWLSHAANVTDENAVFASFRDICLSPDPEFLPWLDSTAAGVDLYKGLIQYAILEKHEPLLQLVVTYVQGKSKSIRDLVFFTPCPGTSVHLLHVAAALGHLNVVKVLTTTLSANVFDGEGKTPLAWAAANSHHDVIAYLSNACQATIVDCQRLTIDRASSLVYGTGTEIMVPLTAILAAQEDPIGFWEFLSFHDPVKDYFLLSPEILPQTLVAACMQGHMDIVRYLQQYGGSLNINMPCIYPLSAKGKVGLLLEFAFDRSGPLRRMMLELGKGSLSEAIETWPHHKYADLVGQVLALPEEDISAMAQALCTTRCLGLLRSTYASSWYDTIISSCGHTELKNNNSWRDAVRNILYYEYHNYRDLGGATLRTRLSAQRISFSVWLETVPDDLLVLLFQLRYISPGVGEDSADQDAVDYFHILSRRFTSRPLACVHLSHEIWRPIRAMETAKRIGAKDVVEHLYAQLKVHSQLATSHNRIGAAYLPTSNVVQIPSETQIEILQGKFRKEVQRGTICCMPTHLVALRCLRRCKNNAEKALKLYKDLSKMRGDVMPDADLSLNFPAGYWKVGHKYAVKLSIVGALYRWSWRLRRRMGRNLSLADVAYAMAVPECLQHVDAAIVEDLEAEVTHRSWGLLRNRLKRWSGLRPSNSDKAIELAL